MDINTVKANLQMIGSRIIDLEIKNNFVYLDLNSETIRREIDVTHDISELYYLDENLLAKNLILDIDLKVGDVLEDEELEMCVKLKLEGCFSIGAKGTEDELTELIHVNGVAALYSIARGIISSLTSQTCVNGTVLLPMINVFGLQSQIEEE